MIQAILSLTLILVATSHIAYVNGAVELLMEFLGLLVVNDIDNWIGMIYEFFLDTFYEELMQNESYLIFQTSKLNKVCVFIYMTLLWVVFVITNAFFFD